MRLLLLSLLLVGCSGYPPTTPVQIRATIQVGNGDGGEFRRAGTAVVVHRCPRHGVLALTCEHVSSAGVLLMRYPKSPLADIYRSLGQRLNR